MMTIPDSLRGVLEALRRSGRPYLVGGCVRDVLLGRAPKDFDVEVFGVEWETLLRALAPWGPTDIVGRSFGVVKVRLGERDYDFSLPRREMKSGAGHRGFAIEPDAGMSEREASARRDFTINALLFDPFGSRVLDFHGGREDLERRILRHTSAAFVEDPLRVLRGFQLAARFAMEMAPETVRLCASMADAFAELPKERIWGEWEKFATQAARPSSGLRTLKQTTWLRHFNELAATDGVDQEPAWHPEGDVFTHLSHCLDALVELAEWKEATARERCILSFAVLAHDLGKATTTVRTERAGAMRWTSAGHDHAGGPLAESFLERLGSPLEIRPVVRRLVECHHVHQSWPLDGPSAAAARRLSHRLMPATIQQLLGVLMADHLGRPPLRSEETALRIERLREAARGLSLERAAPEPLVKGRDLIALGMTPGPGFRPLLHAAYEAQLDGGFSTREEGLAWVKQRVAN